MQQAYLYMARLERVDCEPVQPFRATPCFSGRLEVRVERCFVGVWLNAHVETAALTAPIGSRVVFLCDGRVALSFGRACESYESQCCHILFQLFSSVAMHSMSSRILAGVVILWKIRK